MRAFWVELAKGVSYEIIEPITVPSAQFHKLRIVLIIIIINVELFFIISEINLLVQSYRDEVEDRFKDYHSFDFNSLKLLEGDLNRSRCFLKFIRKKKSRIRRLHQWLSVVARLWLHVHV